MAIAAIKAELIDVDLVGKRDRLSGLVTYNQRLGSCVVSECQGDPCPNGSKAENDFKRKKVRPTRKDIRHES